MSDYLYLGPYVALPKVLVKSVEVVNMCMEKSCVNHMRNLSINSGFCDKCGNKLVKSEKENKEVSRFFDFFSFEEKNGFKGELFYTVGEGDSFRALIPNIDIKHNVSISSSERVNQEVDAEFINNAIKEFEELFKQRHAKLKELHNLDLTVKFGLISYYV